MAIKETKHAKFTEKRAFLSLPDKRLHLCVSGGKKCSFFRKVWRTLFSCNHLLEIYCSTFLPTNSDVHAVGELENTRYGLKRFSKRFWGNFFE